MTASDIREEAIPMDQNIREENEKKKAYLRRYLDAKRKQEAVEREIDELRLDKMFPGSPVQDGMPKGPGGGDLSGYAEKLDELDRELRELVEKKIAVRLEISRKIEEMPDETESLLLRLRYIRGMKWEAIATEMNYTYHHVIKLHGKALNNFKVDTQ